ncbi:uncharacterized protein GGS22DRAFT_186807 [Annulohypoxylon maeteangense]|uniref:uncharacterized protein n=1 Tax=Annulohypoxylon maeteangense TaxID=1927788 RepID=UPI002007B4B9|nr:uncharacterized protein GGS22DRAFT_186807 [Annulohypoxylon maeteangense]KAI0886734.1 hypothetical protein GGS22DRAFT_186807 [Annulohypoxylon maeteangense]
MAPSREQLLKTSNLFLEAFNGFTPESVVKFRSAKCSWRLLPDTLETPAQNNAEYAKLIGHLQGLMPKFRVYMVDGFEPAIDVVTRKVTLHLKSYSETKVGLYQNEYVWVMTFNEDGTEIDEIFEFADSLYTKEWLPRLKTAAEEFAKNKGN